MPLIIIDGKGDGCWSDLAEFASTGRLVDMMGPDAPPIRLAVLSGGMESGQASVSIRLELPDGRVVLTETSLALFVNAANVMRGIIDGNNLRAATPSTTCPKCGRTSYHPEDIRNRYCGACHLFHDNYYSGSPE